MSVGTNEFEIFSRVVCKQNVRIGRNKRLIRSTLNFKLEDAEFDEKGVRRKFIEDSKIEGYPPYYPSSFFKAIKQVHDETPLNVKTMSTSQWVRILTEDGLTMETVDTRQYRPCKAEISAASNDWPLSWRLCRLTGLSSEIRATIDLPSECQYMILSDHLDTVGVLLKSTWTQTRKANEVIVQQRVINTISSWKAGKFMPLTMRPWSINCYVTSKVWFRCGSVDLRVADTSAISSSVKSWLYADLLEKPSEAIMCRPINFGGLGVINVKFKAQAMLIRTFMETAANPQFRNNLLHSVLFRYHVLGDTSVPDPGYPPYYPSSFFKAIKQVCY